MVRVRATGETLSVGRTTFDMPEQLGVRRVWYNPDAKLPFGRRLFDKRIVTRHHPHSVESGVMPLVVGVGLCVAAFYLWRGLLNASTYTRTSTATAKRSA